MKNRIINRIVRLLQWIRSLFYASLSTGHFVGPTMFIGSNAKIMKGVLIGVGSVIANGSIVVGEIPSGVIAGGNPARVLKVIVE